MSLADSSPLRVAIVGCGLIGRKRADALADDKLVACFDTVGERASSLAHDHGGKACVCLEDLLAEKPDVVVVATIHRDLAATACAALDGGSHVLVEKPAGIGVADIDRITRAAEANRRLVKVGFNHRFHPGIARAIGEARSGIHGDVLYLRARYGHGGRLGYEREWRANPRLSGGGEIVDQGMHLLDLSYWLLGELPVYNSMLRTQFWKAPVDDNAVLLLGNPGGVGSTEPFALLHVSWTEWKNTFSLEIACHDAKLTVDGLVRSYGPQTLRIYKMRPELGPPDLEEVSYPDQDDSWNREWQHFSQAIVRGDGSALLGDLASARYAWSCVEQAQKR
jgi:predicted dehydrogenase